MKEYASFRNVSYFPTLKPMTLLSTKKRLCRIYNLA